jgi:hypothetical protein
VRGTGRDKGELFLADAEHAFEVVLAVLAEAGEGLANIA